MYWQLQAEYFRQEGRSAWSSGAVPFRGTSNPFIAHVYAQIILGFLHDFARSDRKKSAQPVTILELGAGPGRFGFLLLRALHQAIHQAGVGKLPRFQYVMTDLADANVQSWLTHPRLQPFFESGMLDVATLDVAALDACRLYHSGHSLESCLGGAPVIVIANYLFDVLVHDAFRVEAGKLHEVRVGLEQVEAETGHSDNPSTLFRQLRFRQENEPIELPYYVEAGFDAILNDYVSTLRSATFLFPVVGLRCLERLRHWSGGCMLLMVSDKARIRAEQLEGRTGLSMAFSGSLTTTVNLDAVARWVGHRGGTTLAPLVPDKGFDTYLFGIGLPKEGRATRWAYQRHVVEFGPRAWLDLVSDAVRRTEPWSMKALLAHLRLSHADPELLVRLEEPLVTAMAEAGDQERAMLVHLLHQAWDNHFAIGAGGDPAFVIGRLLRRLKLPEQALHYYRLSQAERGAAPACDLHMGLCWEMLGEHAQAIHHHRLALEAGQADSGVCAVARKALLRLGADPGADP
ncbi:MAG: hypothetical protein G8237_09330 [Magnetococcales bacterium]|nr:hypothetical protein [Magnetococcales bacterium]